MMVFEESFIVDFYCSAIKFLEPSNHHLVNEFILITSLFVCLTLRLYHRHFAFWSHIVSEIFCIVVSFCVFVLDILHVSHPFTS